MARTKGNRRSEAEIKALLRDADSQRAAGVPLVEVCRELNVSIATYHRWRAMYKETVVPEGSQISRLQAENESLRRIVVDVLLELDALKQKGS